MTKDEALKLARTALGVQLDALLGKAGHLRNDDRRRYAENGITAIKEALAQPEQEPVAWMRTSGTGSPVVTEELLIAKPEYRRDFQIPLYTTPPQRTWVGLTDEEIRKWWASNNGLEDCDMCKIDDFILVAKTIEAKLKEKNR